MKKFVWFFVTVLAFLLVAPVFGQKITGEWLINNSIKQRHLRDDIVGGNELVEGTWSWWFPVSADSVAAGYYAGSGWATDEAAPATATRDSFYVVYGFDADGGSTGDDYAHLKFPIPAQYETDTAEIVLYWFHLDDNGATTDSVEWIGTCQAIGEGEDLYAAGTALTAVYEMCSASDSALYMTTLNIEVETIAAGDLVELKIGVDESDSQLDTNEKAYLLGAMVNVSFKK